MDEFPRHLVDCEADHVRMSDELEPYLSQRRRKATRPTLRLASPHRALPPPTQFTPLVVQSMESGRNWRDASRLSLSCGRSPHVPMDITSAGSSSSNVQNQTQTDAGSAVLLGTSHSTILSSSHEVPIMNSLTTPDSGKNADSFLASLMRAAQSPDTLCLCQSENPVTGKNMKTKCISDIPQAHRHRKKRRVSSLGESIEESTLGSNRRATLVKPTKVLASRASANTALPAPSVHESMNHAHSPVTQGVNTDQATPHPTSIPSQMYFQSRVSALSYTSQRNLPMSDNLPLSSDGNLPLSSSTKLQTIAAIDDSLQEFSNADIKYRTTTEGCRINTNPDLQKEVADSIRIACQSLSKTNNKSSYQSNITIISCSYPNIALKSYAGEKRFLCPPPCVKVNGPRHCLRWSATGLVPEGLHTFNFEGSVLFGAKLSASSEGEECALPNSQREAYFRRLHVNNQTKVGRLQVYLLQGETIDDIDFRSMEGKSAEASTYIAQHLRASIGYTFSTAPITTVSKPSRKIVCSRNPSPLIANGSIVCLYNRLNSQTVRTNYLVTTEVEQGRMDTQNAMNRRLITQQEEWEEFAIELLARPLSAPYTTYLKTPELESKACGITYGCIICLREVRTNICSDPMLICNVKQGGVKVSSFFDGSEVGQLSFKVTSCNRDEAKNILFMGSGSPDPCRKSECKNLAVSDQNYGADYKSNNAGSSKNSYNLNSGIRCDSVTVRPVAPLQKVAFMQVNPVTSPNSPDELICDLSTSRRYLCSGANCHTHDKGRNITIAKPRSLQGEQIPASLRPNGPNDAGSKLDSRSKTQTGTPVNFCSITSASDNANDGQIDTLKDQFCWTIVTVC